MIPPESRVKTRAGKHPAKKEQPILRTERLTRRLRDKVLVDDVTVTVRRGDVLAVVGPSGAGKSSFLRLLVRLDEPTAGTVYLDGVDYRAIPPRELRRRVGYVAQNPALFPGTVAENVLFGPRTRGVSADPNLADGLLADVGLQGFANRNVAGLSGGEAQRVGIARTLANEPEVLLLDEPTSALDPEARGGVEALIRRIISARGLTCVIVTHDAAQAVRLANRAMVMQAGRLIREGPVEEVLNAQPAVR